MEGYIMAKNKTKESFMAVPVEKHDTAAWSNIESTKPISNVTVPSDVQVMNNKEWVDSNQK
jgi:hypothetical protein